MNRLKVLILFFLFFFQKTGFSQPDQDLENWNPGYLVTRDEDTLYGPIMVNFGSDLIQLNEENTMCGELLRIRCALDKIFTHLISKSI